MSSWNHSAILKYRELKEADRWCKLILEDQKFTIDETFIEIANVLEETARILRGKLLENCSEPAIVYSNIDGSLAYVNLNGRSNHPPIVTEEA